MLNLQVRTSETVNLGVLDKGQVTYIEVLQSSNPLRIAGNAGDRNPVHSTALGKAILAYVPEGELEAILERHPSVKMTPKTITRKTSLLKNLAAVRKGGVAIDVEENLTGGVCVAAPIFDHRRKVVAALSLSGPTSRMRPKLKILQKEIRDASVELSRMLQPGPTMPADRQS
jgi:IclR family transcriptional regulator, KDG regulon repressor